MLVRRRRSPFVPRFAPLLALLLVVGGCRSFNVHTDWDDSVSFQNFQRYAWLEPRVEEDADPFADNSLLRKRVRTAIEAKLAERGYRAVSNPAEADFLVTYGVQLDTKTRISGTSGAYGGYYGGWGRWPIGIGTGIGSADVRSYQEAVLIIDFLRPSDEALVWRGWGSEMLQTRDRDRGQERLDEGIEAILKRFPPPATKR